METSDLARGFAGARDGGLLVKPSSGGFVQLLGLEHVGVELADEVDVAMETFGVGVSRVVVTVDLVDQNLVAVEDALGRDGRGGRGGALLVVRRAEKEHGGAEKAPTRKKRHCAACEGTSARRASARARDASWG